MYSHNDSEKKLRQLKASRQAVSDNYNADNLFKAIRNGDRTALSRGLTMIENTRLEVRQEAQSLIEKCMPYSGNSIRVGITGVPGVGKSTFIEALGNYLLEQGHQLAVLAIDPTSSKSSGSILGDKTRMEKLSQNPNAFIRPSSAGSNLGGVARATRENIILCEASGYDVIFIETVGVGQSETSVHAMVDFFLLLMLSGAGDELQGIKRGIIEMADALVINKADGDNINQAKNARKEYQNALKLLPSNENGWIPKVLTCSSTETHGIDNIWSSISNFSQNMKQNGWWEKNRIAQKKYWLHETLRTALIDKFYLQKDVQDAIKDYEKRLGDEKLNPFSLAEDILEKFVWK